MVDWIAPGLVNDGIAVMHSQNQVFQAGAKVAVGVLWVLLLYMVW